MVCGHLLLCVGLVCVCMCLSVCSSIMPPSMFPWRCCGSCGRGSCVGGSRGVQCDITRCDSLQESAKGVAKYRFLRCKRNWYYPFPTTVYNLVNSQNQPIFIHTHNLIVPGAQCPRHPGTPEPDFYHPHSPRLPPNSPSPWEAARLQNCATSPRPAPASQTNIHPITR